MEFFQTAKNRDKLADEGYLYCMHKRSGCDPIVVEWRCEMCRKNKCNARLMTKNGQIVKRMGTHLHEPNFMKVEALKVLREIKDRCLVSDDPHYIIIRDVFAGVSEEVRAQLPSNKSLLTTLRRNKFARQRKDKSSFSLTLPVSFSSEWSQLKGGGKGKEGDGETQSSQSNAQDDDDALSKDSDCSDRDFEGWIDQEMGNAEELEEKPDALQGPVFEIQTLKLTKTGLWTYKKASQGDDYTSVRSAFSDAVLGHWTVSGQGVSQVIQLIKYDSIAHMLEVQRAMENSNEWQEQWRHLEPSVVSSDSILTVLGPQSELCCELQSSEHAVYELQILPEQTDPPMMGVETILVGRFLSLYGPSHTEYRLLRHANPDSAFTTAYHSMQTLPWGSERRLLVPLATSTLH